MSLYTKAFGLSKDPFNLTPDPDLLFMTEQHREALAGLAYSILDRKGFAVLTGPAGTGKTTLVNTVLQSLSTRSVRSSVILNPVMSPGEFLEMALLDFGITDVPASKAQRISRIQNLLMDWHTEGKIAALIVDEAHKLSTEVLEEVRLWSNFEFSDHKLLQIVLVGQSEFCAVLRRPDLQQLKQRIALRFTIAPLTPPEVAAYMKFRWSKSGANASMPATSQAIELIARASGGIPRLINAVCDNALLIAYGKVMPVVTEEHVRAACRDLDVPIDDAPARRSAGESELLAIAAGSHSNGNGDHLPALLPNAVPLPGDDFPPLRTLGGYDATLKRSLWSRLAGKNGKGNRPSL